MCECMRVVTALVFREGWTRKRGFRPRERPRDERRKTRAFRLSGLTHLSLGRTGNAASASATPLGDGKGTLMGGGVRGSTRVSASGANSGNAESTAGTEAVVHASGLALPARLVSFTRPNVSSSQSSAKAAGATDPAAASFAPSPAPKIIAPGSGPRLDRFPR